MSSFLANLTAEELGALSNYPALPPPSGIEPNFATPESQNQPLLIVTSLLIGIMGLFFLNRVYIKTFVSRKYSWDDLTVTLALTGSVSYYVACIWVFQKFQAWIYLLQPAYLIAVLTPPTFLFTKVTFFLMYLQMFQPMRWLRVSAYIGAVFTVAFYSGMTVAQFTFSTPRRGEAWLSHQLTPREKLALAMAVPQSSVGLAIDLYILILPIIAVTQLQLPTPRKVGVILIFSTGIVACLSSLLSIYYRNLLNHSSDTTWVLMPVNTVTLVEMFVGIICACMPSAAHTCRPHLPPYETLKSLLVSRLHTLQSSFKRTVHPSSFSDSDYQFSGTDKTNYSNSSYSNLNTCNHPTQSNLAQNKSIRTFIQGGGQGDGDKGGIQLSYELRTDYQPDRATVMV